MLAHEGYTVLELGYNLPQYGQDDFFTRTKPFDILYFEEAIKKLLQHHTVYGDRVAVLGQSKGIEFAGAAGALLPNLVEVIITNSGLLSNPSWLPNVYYDRTFDHVGFDMNRLIEDTFDPRKDVLEIREQFSLYSWKDELLFNRNSDLSWSFNKDILKKAVDNGFPLSSANKIVHCQTLADPIHSPTPEISVEMTEMSLEGTNADILYVDAGHLVIIPTIPMVHESFMKNWFKTVTHWSRHTTPESKINEAKECHVLYQNIISSLQKYL